MHSFTQYLNEQRETVYFTFGRMNPPTIGHGKLLEALAQQAGRNPYRVYLSHTNDTKKNPLPYKDKVKYVRKLWPRHARSVIEDRRVRTAIDAAVNLFNEGFKRVVFVVGDDRVSEFRALLERYNGEEARHGFYNFDSISVVSAGARDPDAEGIEGMSASKMRSHASNNDFAAFMQGLPNSADTKTAQALFNTVRKGLGLKEQTTFRASIALDPVSERREQYVAGMIFNVGDKVIIEENNKVGRITHRGPNYVIVETSLTSNRYWIDDVSPIEKHVTEVNQPEWGTPESTQKAKRITPGEVAEAALDAIRDRMNAKREAERDRHKKTLQKLAKTQDRLVDRQRRSRTLQQTRGMDK